MRAEGARVADGGLDLLGAEGDNVSSQILNDRIGIADILDEGSGVPAKAEFDEFVQAVKRMAVKGAGRDDATAICIRIGS